MTRVTLGKLEIELTRRCNMMCQHCLRGEPENKDIDLSSIDAVLDQTDMVGYLMYTGGEPLLRLDAMEYVAKGFRKRGILLLKLHIVTNGSVYDQRFVDIIKQHREIIDISCGYGFAPGTYDPAQEISRIVVGVSLDRYHADHEMCEQNYERYKKDLEGIADVVKILHGNVPTRVGRAIDLPEDETVADVNFCGEMQTIEVLGKNYTPVCRIYNEFKLISPEQKIVCCGLYLTADGAVRSGVCSSGTYEKMDSYPKVCNASESIWDNILEYNKGRISCTQMLNDYAETATKDANTIMETLRSHEMRKKADAQDGMSTDAEKVYQGYVIEALNHGIITSKEINEFVNEKIQSEKAAANSLVNVEDIRRESAEYHHGGGQLPEYKQPKPEPVLDVDKLIESMRAYVANPNKTAHCKRCGTLLRDKDGNTVSGEKQDQKRGGAYYECKLCHYKTFLYDFSDLTMELYDFSLKCGHCGKEIIDQYDNLTHCYSSLFGKERYICDYCGKVTYRSRQTQRKGNSPTTPPAYSERCSWCHKVIINSEGKKIHCHTDIRGARGNICDYCGHVNR